jgi:hypothetical protein
MARVFHIALKDPEGFDLRQGWVLAEDEAAARAIVGEAANLVVNAKHEKTAWPGAPNARVCWMN